MPELAEVELARRQWADFRGEIVTSIRCHTNVRIFRNCPADELQVLNGKAFESSKAHGKRMFFTFGPTLHLEIHLGMSGKLHVGLSGEKVHKHTHFTLDLDTVSLQLSDYRQFGLVCLHYTENPWANLPPQPQDQEFTRKYLEAKIERHSRKPLKALLLDQTVCPGIGNWMADEICWKMGLHPATPSAKLNAAELRKAIRFVTLGALRHIADKNHQPSKAGFAPGSYVAEVPPKSWLFQHRWKAGGECPKCGSGLERDTIASRTTAWCPECQAAG